MSDLILLHGALGAASTLATLARTLGSIAEVHVLEFSGHGNAAWPKSFGIETFEADVLRLMDEQNITSAHLFGYSMGGFVGLRLAQRVPERVRSLTTLATKLDWTKESCAAEARMLDADTIETKVPKFAAALDSLHKGGWKGIVAATKGLIEGMHCYRFASEDFAAMTVPIRLMVGDRDKMVSIQETMEAYRALPAASLCVLPGTPHPLEAAPLPLLARLIEDMIAG